MQLRTSNTKSSLLTLSLPMASSQIQQLHFLLIPLMSQSHIIPLTDLAKLLAARGVTVSLITTPRNATRYQAIIDRANSSNLNIRLISLEFPGHDVGLPKGCENLDSLSSRNLMKPFFDACAMMQQPLEKLISELEPKPSCIVSTSALPWTQFLAQKFNIPRYIFETVSCFTVMCSRRISQISTDSDVIHVPDIPHKITFTKSESPDMGMKSPDGIKSILDHIQQVESLARGVLWNNFEGLDSWYLNEYKKSAKNVWCVGPVSLCNKQVEDKINRGNKISIDGHLCLKWLDSKAPRSVIYACFGSLSRLKFEQLKEIGLGLEGSGRPFIWIIREVDYTPEIDIWLKDEKFSRGLVIKGWAPQVLILSHTSVGAFLTHCGWNSTLEGICSGVPMITWPMFAEQFYNEKFVVDILGIGVKVGVEGVVEEEKKGVLVRREKIKEAIDRVMRDDGESKERRKRAKMVGEMARNATEEGGSSCMNITSLIEDVMHVQQQKGNM